MNLMRFGAFALLMLTLSSPAAGKASDEFRLEQLAWLVGDWRIEIDKQIARETWLEPVNGFMWATFRLFDDDHLVVHEYIVVTEEVGGVVMRFKHFNADYSTWEKNEPLTFLLTKVRDNYARFENIVTGLPHSPDIIEYQRFGNKLKATISDKPGAKAGEPMEFDFKLYP